MTRNPTNAFILLVALLVISCNSNEENSSELKDETRERDRLEKLLDAKVEQYKQMAAESFDSAQAVLQDLLLMLDTLPESHNKLCIRPYISIAEELAGNGLIRKSASLYQLAEIEFRKTMDSSLLPFMYLNKGLIEKLKGNYDSATLLFRESLHLARKYDDTTQLLPAMINLGNILLTKEYSEEGMGLLKTAVKLASKTGATQNLADVANNIGVAYEYQGNLSQAMYYYKMAIDSLEAIGSMRNYLSPLNNLANTYLAVGNDSLAELYYNKVLEHAEKMNKEYLQITAQINLGNFYLEHNKYDHALAYAKAAESGLKETTSTYLKTINYLNLGLINKGLGNKELAIRYLRKALQLANEIAFFNIMIETNIQLGFYLVENGKADSALLMAKTARQFARDNKTIQYLPDIYHLLARSYELKKQYPESIQFYQKYIQANKRYNDTLMAEKTKYFAFYNELQKKQSENKLLLSEKRLKDQIIQADKIKIQNRDNLIILIALSLLLAASLAIILDIKRKNKSRTNRLLLQKNNEIEEKNRILEKENQFKNKLFSIVSHDVRSPLVSIYSVLNILALKKVEAGKQDQLVLENIALLEGTIEMVDNLLLWTKQQLTVDEIRKEKFNVHALISEVVNFFSNKIEEQKIILDINCPGKLFAFSDYNISKIVLQNLLSNALKFTDDGGHIHIHASENGKMIVISVVDNGMGMNKETAHAIIHDKEINSQIGKRQEKGHGLGLKLCRFFAEKNQGRLWFDTEEEKGSAFHFSIEKA